ncbi:MAG: hypothetical protein J5I50_10940 [Chitinophagaceae bacterium]|nr:hypothetical protein [Chitinophagaceae bacterium]
MRKALLLLILFAAFSANAQKKKSTAVQTKSTTAVDTDSVLFSKLNYRLIGPFVGGRSAAVAGSYTNKNTFYFGGVGGGVFKTTDGGANWVSIADKYIGGGIGAIAVAPTDEDIIYVGGGENTVRGNVSESIEGVYRTDDGGKTWRNIGLKDGRHIIRLIIHPKNPDIVWAAVMGHLFGPNEERGVYKTTDGGKTWKRVLFVNDLTACSDLVMEPGNPKVLYAGMWRLIRTPYSLESGGEGSGLWKSTDGGETWKNVSANKGLPKGTWGIVGVAVAPSNTDKVYSIIENQNGGLFMSNDGGETWTLTNSDNNIRQRAWYYTKVFVDPHNENKVYCPNVGFMRSTDGGRTFQSVRTPHSDHHDLWIDPTDGNRMIVGDDGGGQVTFDGGATWSTMMNQPTVETYRLSTDNSFPYNILFAQQDNGAYRLKSRTAGIGITQSDLQNVAGSESGYIVADPSDPEITYGGNYQGLLQRLDLRTGESRMINIWPIDNMGAGAEAAKYRFQWNYPIFFSPHNPKRLYAAGNHLFVTENEGRSWEMISPDLTTNDKSRQGSSGGPITKDNTSVEYYCTIFYATESWVEKDLLWTGSDDGVISVSRDGGKNWENVTPKDAPEWMMWNCIEVDPFKKGAAYFVGTRYKLDDYKSYIYKTEDYGKTWKLIVNGIDPMHFARALRADRKRPGLLYAGTEYGMYISYDDGAHWKPFQLNMPIVSVVDLAIKNNDLIVGTQGRSLYVLDDLTVLQEKKDEVLDQNLHVFTVIPAYRFGGGGRFFRGFGNVNMNAMGKNPPNGVVFNYYLKNADKVSVTIMDKNKKEIRTFRSGGGSAPAGGTPAQFGGFPGGGGGATATVSADQGMNQFVWDMNYPPAERVNGLILWNGFIGSPKAAPGEYFAKFKAGTDSVEVPFTILPNPNYKTTLAEYQEQFDFQIKLRDKFSEVMNAIKNIRDLRQQMNDFSSRTGKDMPKDIKDQISSIQKEITGIEEALHQTKAKSSQDVLNFPIKLDDKLSSIYRVASSGEAGLPKQARDAYNELVPQIDEQLNKWKNVLNTDVNKLNKLIHESSVPVIHVKG